MSVYFALFRSQSEMIEINILFKIVVYLPPVTKVKVEARILDIAFLGRQSHSSWRIHSLALGIKI